MSSERKKQHLMLAHQLYQAHQVNDFDRMHVIAPALPETRVNQQAIAVKLGDINVAAPFFMEAMTGGSKASERINKSLGKIAAKHNIALALGSASLLEKSPDQFNSFWIARQEDPDGFLLANINPETPPRVAQKIVNTLNANALQIHVNAPQEITMVEGDRNFIWLDKLDAIREAVTVPVIIKAVGFGFDRRSLLLLNHHHYDWVDVGGRGGTNFIAIENQRGHHAYDYLDDLGLSTIQSLILGQKMTLNLIASGGVRNPLDIIKSMALGAKFVGIANTFLETLQTEGEEGLDQLIGTWKSQLTSLVALFGANQLSDLPNSQYYLDADFKDELIQLQQND